MTERPASPEPNPLGIFSILPEELFLDILGRIAKEDQKTLFRLRRVSTLLSKLIFRPEIWHTLSWTNKDNGPPQRAMMMAFREVATQARELGIRGITYANFEFVQDEREALDQLTRLVLEPGFVPKKVNWTPMLQCLLAHHGSWLETLGFLDHGVFLEGARGGFAGPFAAKHAALPALKQLPFVRGMRPLYQSSSGVGRADPRVDKLLVNLSTSAPNLVHLALLLVTSFPSLDRSFNKWTLLKVQLPRLEVFKLDAIEGERQEIDTAYFAKSMPNLKYLMIHGRWYFSVHYEDRIHRGMDVPFVYDQAVDGTVQLIVRLKQLEHLNFEPPPLETAALSSFDAILGALARLPYGNTLKKVTFGGHLHFTDTFGDTGRTLKESVQDFFARRRLTTDQLWPGKPVMPEVVEIVGGWPYLIQCNLGKWEFFDEADNPLTSIDAEREEDCWCMEDEDGDQGYGSEYEEEEDLSQDWGSEEEDDEEDFDEDDYDEGDDHDGPQDGPAAGPSTELPPPIPHPWLLNQLANIIRFETGRQPSMEEVMEELQKVHMPDSWREPR